MKPGDQDDLTEVVRIIRSVSDGEALQSLRGVVHAANERGYAAGLAEATTGSPVSLSPDQQRAFVWASHQRSLALRHQAVENMKKTNAPPDLIHVGTLLLDRLQETQLLLMGLDSGTLVLVRVKDGSSLDCFRFDPA